MFKIYDSQNNFLKLVEVAKGTHIDWTLETGLKTLSLKLPLTQEYMQIINYQGYIETSTDRFIIKEINYKYNVTFDIYCKSDIEELKYTLVPIFDVIDVNVETALQRVIGGTTWTLEYNSDIVNAVEYKLTNSTIYDIIKQIKQDFDLDVLYDTKNKIVKVYTKVGKEKGAYFSNELRLKMLQEQGQTFDYCTVLYPIGKDGLTISSINNGSPYIENFQYTDKYLPMFWIQDDIEQAQELKMKAEAYLAVHSTPIVGYSLRLSELPQEVSIGDEIILVDKIKKIKQKQRIVKIIKYPFEPQKDKVEISNRLVNFADTMAHYNTNYDKQIAYIKNNIAELK